MNGNKINCDLQFEDFIYDIVDGNVIITKYQGDKRTLYVPAFINEHKVIGFDVFDFGSEEVSSIRHIILPGTIQRFSFWDHNQVETIRIEPGCKCIPDGAFSHLRNLKLVDLPDTITTIGKEAFAYCKSLQYIRIPDECTYIGDDAFAYSGLRDFLYRNRLGKLEGILFVDVTCYHFISILKTKTSLSLMKWYYIRRVALV